MPLRMGNLAQLLKTRDKAVLTDNKLAYVVLGQMLSALDYLACNNVCHRDVKPENIVYYWVQQEDDKAYTFQLADFGLTTRIGHPGLARTQCGTGMYMAPEVHFGTFGQTP